MKTTEETTFVRPEYRRTSAGHKPIDGVQFFSYDTGILRYARISEDGQIMVARNYNKTTYHANIIGHGAIKSPSGGYKAFHTEDAATRAAIEVWRKLKEHQP